MGADLLGDAAGVAADRAGSSGTVPWKRRGRNRRDGSGLALGAGVRAGVARRPGRRGRRGLDLPRHRLGPDEQPGLALRASPPARPRAGPR
jgi:hypothetical protein